MYREALECLSLAALLTSGIGTIVAQSVVPTPGTIRPAYLRPFGHGQPQLPVAREAGVRLTLLRTECNDCAAGPTFVFEVTGEGLSRAREFTLSNGTGQIDEMRIAPNGTAILVGRVDANTSYVTLVDPATGEVKKEFYAFDPSVSSDNRWIAFVKPYPLHFTPGVSNEYMAYDVEAYWPGGVDISPPSLATKLDAGEPIYPEGAPARYGGNIVSDAAEIHSWASDGFHWLAGQDILAFADYWRSAVSLVVADFRGGVRTPTVTVKALDRDDVMNAGACTAYSGRLGPAFGVDGATLTTTNPLTVTFALRPRYPDCTLAVPQVDVVVAKM